MLLMYIFGQAWVRAVHKIIGGWAGALLANFRLTAFWEVQQAMTELCGMEAENLPDGRTNLWLSRAEFSRLPGLVGEADGWLRRKGASGSEFRDRVGITAEEAQSLRDELVITRKKMLDIPPLVVPQTGEFIGPTEIRRAGTAWDYLPRIVGEKLSDDGFVLVLARGELAILANCIDVVLHEMAYMSPEGLENELHSRTGMWSWEFEAFRDELRRLDRKARARSSS